MSQQHPQQMAHYKMMVEHANNALVFIRAVRTTVAKLIDQVHAGYDLSSAGAANTLRQRLEGHLKQFEEFYNRLESHAHALPDKMPSVEMLSRLKNIYQEDQGELAQQLSLDELVDAVNLNDTNQHYFMYAGEFSRTGTRKKQSLLDIKPITFSDWEPNLSPHIRFEMAFAQVQKEFASKKAGIWSTILERNTFGSVIEVKFGVIHERIPVIQQKVLLVENHGIIEMISFIAPHEDWIFLDSWMGKKVDLSQQSKYQVYQRLTAHATVTFQSVFGAEQRLSTSHVSSIIQLLSRYQQVFEIQCKVCKKVMKDFLPCTVFDPRYTNQAMHETCR